jgi:Asp-tRNA(Asn)/Glu-tRNA(Gln) amidotransferase A subunit family amidase
MTAETPMKPEPPPAACDLTAVRAPVLRGWKLRTVAGLLRSPLRGALTGSLASKFGLPAFRRLQFREVPEFYPVYHGAPAAEAGTRVPVTEWPARAPARPGFHVPSAMDYAAAYRRGKATPVEVAQQFLAAQAGDTELRAFVAVQSEEVMRQAKESTQRISEGRARSVLEGVPVAVKDEVAMVPYPTTAGTAWLGKVPAASDATVVARLRAAGALLLGKTAMHEIGMGVTGLNVLQGTPRNPCHPGHYCGGSSSGSAAAVAAGLCPIATGADGGGSVRIPPAFCGVTGLKPTFGRLSTRGAVPLCWSVGHLGVIAGSAADAALAYAIMAGPDAEDALSLHQPAPGLAGWNHMDLNGVRIGVYDEWFRLASPEIVKACQTMLRQFEFAGAEVRPIVIPDLEAARLALAVSIAAEIAHCVDHVHGARRERFNLDVQITLAVARTISSSDYIRAQQVRARMMDHFARAFESVDVIATPATGATAPMISPLAAESGESDLGTATEIMRFTTPANLTGLPAIAFPAGYTHEGLPIGMQLIGRPWDEVTLLRMALVAEQWVERRQPKIYHSLLP